MANSKDSFDPVPLDPDQLAFINVELPGWPGYRTRPGRSGLDYIDTQLELAHMTGVFIRQFFSGVWRRSKASPQPVIPLIVGLALIFSMPGGVEVCPGVLMVLLVSGLVALGNRYSRGKQTPSEHNDS